MCDKMILILTLKYLILPASNYCYRHEAVYFGGKITLIMTMSCVCVCVCVHVQLFVLNSGCTV